MSDALLINSTSPVPQAQALGAHVVTRLRHAIISGEIPHDTHLVEGKLSTTFDVSRGPIRDALRQLETEGLVESRRRGVYTVGLHRSDVNELYALREALEIKAMELARAIEDESAWAPVLEHLEAMKECASANDSLGFARADLRFHSAFYQVAGNGRLESSWKQYEPTFSVMLELTNAEDRDLGPTYADHVDLYEVLRNGDLTSAATLLREHLQGSRDRLTTAFERLHAEH